MRLNPAKYTFTVHRGMFLGYMMTHKGIDSSTDQVKVIAEMPSPRIKKRFKWLLNN